MYGYFIVLDIFNLFSQFIKTTSATSFTVCWKNDKAYGVGSLLLLTKQKCVLYKPPLHAKPFNIKRSFILFNRFLQIRASALSIFPFLKVSPPLPYILCSIILSCNIFFELEEGVIRGTEIVWIITFPCYCVKWQISWPKKCKQVSESVKTICEVMQGDIHPFFAPRWSISVIGFHSFKTLIP